jgi:hypothetical protein
MVVPIAQGVGQLSTGLLGILGDDERGGQADIGDHAFFAAHTQVQLIAVQRQLIATPKFFAALAASYGQGCA